jgi:exodeoxyribonuclease V gamma subunit
MPMRTVPFRFVGIIGMNDGLFPRRDVYASFNRMAYSIHKGDRIKRNEDRYLFLESLLSARQWFYLSYVGQSLHDNAVLPPSVLVSELQDYIARIDPKFSRYHIIQHRLQAFSKPYLQADTPFFTYSSHLADTQNLLNYRLVEFWQNDCLAEAEPSARKINLQSLIRFFQHPARVFLNERFQLKLGEQSYELPNREPFDLARFQDGEIRGRIYQALIRQQPTETVLKLLRAEGHLPHGELGDLLFKQELQNTELFYQQYGAPPATHRHSFQLSLGEFELVGVVDHLTASQRRIYEMNSVSYYHWLEHWLKHLVLNSLERQPIPQTSLIYSFNRHTKTRQMHTQAYTLQPLADAQAQLLNLLTHYWQGLQQPLNFFPKSALALAETSEHKLTQAQAKWDSSGQYEGEREKPEYQLLYRDTNPLEQYADSFSQLALSIYTPFLACKNNL